MSYPPYQSPATARSWAKAREKADAKARASREASARGAELHEAISMCLDRLLPMPQDFYAPKFISRQSAVIRARYTASKVITARASADPKFKRRLLEFYYAEFGSIFVPGGDLDRLLSDELPNP